MYKFTLYLTVDKREIKDFFGLFLPISFIRGALSEIRQGVFTKVAIRCKKEEHI